MMTIKGIMEWGNSLNMPQAFYGGGGGIKKASFFFLIL
jgi:hypothetical protein